MPRCKTRVCGTQNKEPSLTKRRLKRMRVPTSIVTGIAKKTYWEALADLLRGDLQETTACSLKLS
jgi:hypothetical protein